ncbi:MAG TPA: signal peptidase II [Micromonosporaceae bacterium]|nr:signal peptidase II [Micromonosporaceae bacterium]
MEQVGTGPVGPSYRHRAVLVLVVAALAVLVVDLASKQLAVTELTGRGPVRLLGGALYLVLTRNSGAAFSLARDYTFVFPVVTLVVVGWIAWASRRLRSVPWGVALGLVLGGATGNLVDRIFRAPGPFVGHVVDFLSLLDEHGQFFPVFNVADMSLVSGVVLAILLELAGRRRDGTRHPDDPDPADADPADADPADAPPDQVDAVPDRVDARPGAGAPGRGHA